MSDKEPFDENQPTTRQIIIFTVVLAFIVSVIGTVLALGIFGPLFGVGETSGGPFLFNRPKILEKIIQSAEPKETSERILRQDELVVKVVEEASPAVVSIVASKDVPVIERYYVNPFSNDPFFKQFFGDQDLGLKIPQYRQKALRSKKCLRARALLFPLTV